MWEDTEEMDRRRDRAIEEHGWCDEHQTLADTCKKCIEEHDGEDERLIGARVWTPLARDAVDRLECRSRERCAQANERR